MDRDRGPGLAGLLAVALSLFLAAPHAAPALERVGAGRVLRQAARRLPDLRGPEPDPRSGNRASTAARQAVAYALDQRGKPYRWGAEGPAAFDCSGLTYAAYRSAGLRLPRTAATQLTDGGPRVARDRLLPGDLVFFRTNGPTGRHVGLYLGAGRMVEAPNRRSPVRVASIGRPGYLGAVRPVHGRGGDRR